MIINIRLYKSLRLSLSTASIFNYQYQALPIACNPRLSLSQSQAVIHQSMNNHEQTETPPIIVKLVKEGRCELKSKGLGRGFACQSSWHTWRFPRELHMFHSKHEQFSFQQGPCRDIARNHQRYGPFPPSSILGSIFWGNCILFGDWACLCWRWMMTSQLTLPIAAGGGGRQWSGVSCMCLVQHCPAPHPFFCLSPYRGAFVSSSLTAG